MNLFRQVLGLFDHREKLRLLFLTTGLVVRAGVETIGVASIAPFMSIVADPTVISRSPWLSRAYDVLEFQSHAAFLTAVGVAVIVVLTCSNAFSAAALWAMLRFSWSAHHHLAMRMFSGYLRQPYSFFVQRNSASLNKTILAEIASVTTGVLVPLLNIVARGLVIVALVALLILLDPLLAIVVVVVLGGAYGGIYLGIRQKQKDIGRRKIEANEKRYKVAGETFGGIKDVLVMQRQGAFLRQFNKPSWTFSRVTASNAIIAQLPRYLLETIAFGGIVVIVVYYLQSGKDLVQTLPVLSLYAFAGYRLIPELQQLFAGLAHIRFHRAALDDLVRDLNNVPPPSNTSTNPQRLWFKNSIELRDVSFRYPDAPRLALDRVSLSIKPKQTVGLVGESGSGKTTLADLLLGLYEPQQGAIFVDGIALDPETIPRWQREIGYVPQHIFLSDDTIAANIAFGIPNQEIDRIKLERAARVAHLHDFIVSLPSGYDTVVGERGVRLSGGQQQRIGIARALYHDPPVLILDEATSALDGATENTVMEAIRDLSGHKTMIIIAHRLTTVQNADKIVLLEAGKLKDEGTYLELLQRSDTFKQLAQAPAVR